MPSPLRLLATLLLVLGLPGAAAAATRPNIVFVLTDDEEVALVERMPNVKALVARQGATFTHAYYNDPLCTPSRITMLTGRYAQNTRVPSNRHELFYRSGGADDTVAVWLHRAGYRTALIGKYMNGYPDPAPVSYIPPGWDRWAVHLPPSIAAFNYRMQVDGQVVEHGSSPSDYDTDVAAGLALDFVREATADKAPFFLWLAASPPHPPAVPAPRHADLFPDLEAPRPPSFDEADVSDKPAFVRRIIGDEPSWARWAFQHAREFVARFEGYHPGWVSWIPGLGTLKQIGRGRDSETTTYAPGVIGDLDGRYRDRVSSLQSLDEAVKAIVDLLASTGQLDNTYIVFASDNGWVDGEHRLHGKGLPYEEVARMPLLIRGPGVAAGQVLEHLVGNADLAPTFAEWAGAEVPGDLDGRSLAPLLRPGAPTADGWRQAYGMQYDPGYGPDQERWPPWRAVRTRDLTYAEYATGERELYDDEADPYQLHNLARTADAGLLARLSGLTGALAACEGAECRRLEDGDPATAWKAGARDGPGPSSVAPH